MVTDHMASHTWRHTAYDWRGKDKGRIGRVSVERVNPTIIWLGDDGQPCYVNDAEFEAYEKVETIREILAYSFCDLEFDTQQQLLFFCNLAKGYCCA